METLDNILEAPASKAISYAELEKVEQELENLLKMGLNDETLVSKKRMLLKKLYNF